MNRTPPMALPRTTMAELVAGERATRLLPEFEVGPTHFDGRWWYVPDEAAGEDYVPAPADLAAHYDEWRAEVIALDTVVETYEAEIRRYSGRTA